MKGMDTMAKVEKMSRKRYEELKAELHECKTTRADEVALSCGFKDYSTFYRMFKKCYGITPTDCRRMGKKPGLKR